VEDLILFTPHGFETIPDTEDCLNEAVVAEKCSKDMPKNTDIALKLFQSIAYVRNPAG
jgi:hypothetical protein